MKTKSILRYLTGIVVAGLFSLHANSQNVNVSGALVGNGSYATLAAAFTAINSGAQTGATIQVTVVNNTTEGTGTATLNAGTWTALSIQPIGGAWTISGTTTAGNPMVDFNGADNVYVDGQNSGGNALTFSNTTVSATSGTSTIRLQADATNNTITRCSVLGSSTMAVGTNGGNIWFGAGAITTGSDNNTISFCDIGPAGTNLPTKGIYFSGTTTTSAQNNSYNTITNNNIFDFFSATTTSAGVYITTGTTDITIQNNKFYQSAGRTQTTGTQHSAVWITNANGNNYTVSGNTIGYASSAATGTYTLTGLAGTLLVPIYINVGTTTASNVQGNTITAIAMSGAASGTSNTSPFRGIYINAGVVNIGNTTGNTIGSMLSNGAISYTSSAVANSEIMGIYNFSTSNALISNNTIGGITAGNSSAGAAIIYGIRVNTAAAAFSTIQNNNIGGATVSSIQSTSPSTASLVQGILVNLSSATITGNNIASLSVISGNGTTIAPSVGGIVVNATGSNHTITGNKIAGIGNLNPTSTGSVTGIMLAAGTGANLVSENLIHSLVAASAGATMNGIYVSTSTCTYRNNMIRLGIDPVGNPLTSGMTINGINEVAGINNFYFNTVYVGGSGVGGANNTFAFQSTVVTNVRNYQDNIFWNARSNGAGTGKHYGIRVGGTAPNPAGLLTNYNDILTTGTGGVFGLFNAVDQASLAAWRTSTGQDANSISSDPMLINPTGDGITVDLHVSTAATPIEQAGTPIAAVTSDYDGQTRSSFTPTDIGADAGNFTALDIAAPTIIYPLLPFSCSTSDRVFTATITDYTGVPASGAFQPRVYYRKNAGPYFSSQGILTSGSATNGVWTFTIVAADMGGLATADVVSYFVIAQDVVTPVFNIGSNPSAGLIATDVNTVTTPPTANSFVVSATLSGTYTVGAAGNYPTLTAAVNAYNTNCIGGPIIFSLIDPTYSASETFPIIVNQNPSASAINTLTIKPAATSAITGSANTALIKILGNYVTIDGSNSGGPSRDLTITNTSVTTPNIILLGSTGTTPIMNSAVKNCILINGAQTSSGVVISDGTTLGAAGYFTNITIQNNSIQRSFIGLYSIAVIAAGNGNGLLITQNDLNTAGANSNRLVGIYAQGIEGAIISNNNIGNMANTADAASLSGMFIATGSSNCTITGNNINGFSGTAGVPVGIRFVCGVAASNSIIRNNTITGITSSTGSAGNESSGIYVAFATGGVTIDRNNISNIKNTSASGWGSNGINLASTLNAANINVINNFISDVASFGFTTATVDDNGYGMVLTAGGGYNIYHNTINMTTSQSLAGGLPAAINITAGISVPSSINLRNNIFVNTQAASTQRYAIYCGTANNVFASINYNDYYTTGPNIGFIGSNRLDITAIQAGFGSNTNSVSLLPVFTGAPDLHLPAASNAPLSGLAAYIAAVPADIDQQTRGTTCGVDMGADEFSTTEINVQGNALTITDGDVTPSNTDFTDFGTQSVCNGTLTRTFTIQNTGATTLTVSSVTISGANASDFTVTTAPAASVSPAGSTTFVVTFNPSAAGSRNATININNSDCDEAVYNFDVLGTGTQITVSAVSQTNVTCNGGNDGAATVSTSGGIAPVTFAWAPSGGTAATASGLTAASYTCTVTDFNGCTATQVFNITEPPVLSVNATAASPAICNGSSTTLTGSGATTYAWMPGSLSGTTVTVSPITTTTYTVTGTNALGCTGTNVVTVTVNPLPTVSASAASPSICTGSSTTLTGNGATTYTWMPGSLSGTTVTISPTATTTYTVTGTDGNGCSSTGNTTVTVNPLPTVSATAGTPTICNGSSTTLTGSGATTYTWMPGSLSGTTVTVSPTATTTYTVAGTDGNGCSATGVVTVTVNPLPTVTATAGSPSICVGGSSSLTGSGASTYAWMPGSLSGTTVTVSPVATTTYTVTGTDVNGCSNTGNVTVTVNPTPTVTATASPSTICNGSSSSLTGSGAATYTWMPGSLSGTTVTVSPTATTTYTVTGTSGAGCTSTGLVTVTVNPLPVVSATASPSTICSGNSTSLTGSGATTYAWMPGSLSGTTVSVSPASTTTYTITGTDGNGCSSTGLVTVTVNPTPTVTATASPSTICSGNSTSLTGNGATTYSWMPGSLSGTTVSVSPATTTTYTVTGTSTGCSSTGLVTVTVNPTPTVTATASPSTICSGNSTSLTGSGATTYSWMPGSLSGTTVSVSPATTTTYTVTGTSTGCSSTGLVTVTVNPTPTVTATASPSTICSGNSTSLTGNGATTYSWMPGSLSGTTVSVSPATTTTYTVTGTSTGCSSTGLVTVTVNPTPTVTATASPSTICSGNSTSLTGSGATTYSWMPGSLSGTTVSVSPTTTTTYTVTGTSTGCSSTGLVTVTVNPTPTVTATASPSTICSGNSTSLTGSGATTYSWMPGSLSGTTVSVSPATTTTYTVTGTSTGCSSTGLVTVTVNPTPTVTATASPSTICSGNSTSLTGNGATTYSWMPGSLSGTTVSVSPATTTTYTVTGTSTGCSSTGLVTVTVNPTPTVTATASPSTICSGNSTSLTGSGATTYSWMPGSLSGTTVSVSPATTTTYTVTGTSTGCSSTGLVTVTVNPTPTVTATASPSTICSGNSTSLTGSGATTYSWMPGSLSGTTVSVSPATTTTYTVTGTSTGCSSTGLVTVTVNPTPTVTATASPSTICSGNSTSLTGSGATTYSWMPGSLSGTTVSVSPATTTTYTVTGTSTGCSSTGLVTVTVNPLPTVTASSTASAVCSGNSVTLTGGGATSYSWSGGVINAVAFAPASTNTYTVTGTDVNGCTNTATTTVTVNALPVVSLGPDVAQCSGSVLLNAQNAGSTYLWSDNSTSQTLSASATGIYWVDVTNGNGCTSRDSIAVTINTNPVVALGADITQCGGTVLLDAGNPGATYLWSDNSTSQTLTVSSTGTYSVLVTLTGGCTATDAINVTINSLPVVNLGADITQCSGTATLDAQNAGSSYLWNDNTTMQTLTASVTGIYWVDVTNTNGCTSRDSIMVTINPNPVVAFGADITQCGGTALLDAGNAGATYLWSDNSTNQTLTVSSTGTYSVTVTNAFGCSATDAINVTINAIPVVALGPDVAQCSGSVLLDAQNTGSTYLWSDNTTAQTLTASTTGIYWVDVTNASGCTSRDSVSITINSNPVVAFGPDITQCGGTVLLDAGNAGATYLWSDNSTNQTLTAAATGVYSVLVTLTGGCTAADTISITINIVPVVALGADTTQCGGSVMLDAMNTGSTYLWSDNSTNQALNVSATGIYNVTVTGATGCTASDTISVTINAVPVVALGNDTIMCGGSLVLDAQNAGATYLWSDNSAAQTLLANATGIYSVAVTNASGCSANDTISITINPVPAVNIGPDSAICVGTIFLDAANAGDTYLWSDNTTSQTLTAVSSGIYWVDVTNASGCTSRDSVSITINSNPVVTLGNDTMMCGGSILLDAGNAGANYLWNDSSTNQTLLATTSGTYYVLATLSGGCTATDTIVITINSAPVVNLGSDISQCGGVTLLNAGAGPNSAYLWSDNSTAQTLAVSTSGLYYVTVTDSVTGCTAADSINVAINAAPNVVFSVADTVCDNGGFITLSGTPAGGTFFGVGVSGSTFDPTVPGPGSTTLTYSYTDINGCTGSANQPVFVDDCSGINEIANTSSLVVYPNPNNGQFTVVIKQMDGEGVLEITDALGQMISSESIAPVNGVITKQINLGIYASGIYFVRFTTNATTTVEKVNVQR